MTSYFLSLRGAGVGQPLKFLFDGSMPEVGGAKLQFGEVHSSDSEGDRLIAHC